MHTKYFFVTSCLGFTLFACELNEPHKPIILGSPSVDGGGSVTAGTSGSSSTTGGNAGAGGSGAATTGDTTTGAGGSGGAGGGGTAGGAGGPTGITLTEPTNSEATPGQGGSEFTQQCADGQAVVSFTGTWGGSYMGLESLQAACATLGIAGSGPYQVTLTPDGSTLGPYGEVSPETIDSPCPEGQAVVGFEGRAGDWVDQLLFHCAPLTISGAAGSYTLEVGTSSPTSTAVGPGTGIPFSALSCEAGKIAVGIFGRSGAAIDAIGLACAKPTLTTMRR